MIVALLFLSGLIGYEVGITEHEYDYNEGYYHGTQDGTAITNEDWCWANLNGKQSEMLCKHCVTCEKEKSHD